jgi:hypothetical protein
MGEASLVISLGHPFIEIDGDLEPLVVEHAPGESRAPLEQHAAQCPMFWLLIREVLLVVSVLAKNCQGSKAAKTISA